ncbi:MAG: hypothetical protein ACOY3L_05385 [Pseudomonadota bacterium]
MRPLARSHRRNFFLPSLRRKVVLCLFLLAAFVSYSALHASEAEAELMPAYAQGQTIQNGHADNPCDRSTPGCDHKAHLGCASGSSGCHFAAVMPEAAAFPADTRLASPPRQASFLRNGAMTPLFRPPRSSVRA